jgi:hypothetical protein
LGKLIKIVALLLLILIVSAIAIFIAVLENEPLVTVNSGRQLDQAESVKVLMKQLKASVDNRTDKQNINISQEQLNSLVGIAQRANSKIKGQAHISPTSSRILASYNLPANPIGQYLNIDVVLLPGPGVSVGHVKLGPFSIPGDIAVSSLVTLANWYTNSDIASSFLQQVEYVSMSEQKMVLSVLPLEQFLKELNQVKGGLGGVDDEELRLKTAYYLKSLATLKVGKRTTSPSLAEYIGPLFSWAKKRSNSESAGKENEAAIMALAIFAGHHRFANLIGEVQPVPGKVALPRAKAVLYSRVDLNQHFIYSAAIKILSEQGMSMAIGEFKELMDRSKGGSGFSFVDLAADFAGVKFAEAATNEATAGLVQNVLAGNTDEAAFFPNVVGLPEGLSKAEFTITFTSVYNAKYRDMIDDIHQRISVLPIHKYQ